MTCSVSNHALAQPRAELVFGTGELKAAAPLLSLLSEFSLSDNPCCPDGP